MKNQRGIATESVWDYPRPPRVEADSRRIVVKSGGIVIADSTSTMRILETSHPPAFYLPARDVDMSLLKPGSRHTFCEFKGTASYYDLIEPNRVRQVGWTYLDPSPGYEEIKDMICFYPSKVECYVADERVTPQEGGFYGGWITGEIVGPFKGAPGTLGW
jgi:uncharacterized protein (DUF427 family)